MKFSSVLVANRGEIAVRIIRTAKAMGYRTVAVYSDVDAEAAHVRLADQAVRIGPAAANESYLVIDNILAAAKTSGAEAVHPGYGFLAENADFAQACVDAGLTFIGPSSTAIEQMGNKAAAKALMEAANVPCIPGFRGEQDDAALIQAAENIGLPVMVKAAAGGGGRGMRRVADASELANGIKSARSEAENAFGSGELIIEKALDGARHVEVQVFADSQGNAVHLGERDCSVQRRHQKVVEESPSPAVDNELRERMGQAAVDAALAVNYQGAGTVEFLLAADGEFYFLEMNTRLQVEHPVTEFVTGLDLVEWQLRIAAGESLPLAQEQIALNGHAIELRLCAEDPYQDFLPQAGPVLAWSEPQGQGVRTDHCLIEGVAVSPFYDSMQGKLIAYGSDRAEALRRLRAALERSCLLGVRHNFDFLAEVLANPVFAAGDATTAFIGEHYPEGVKRSENTELQQLAAVLATLLPAQSLWQQRAISPELQAWSSSGAVPRSVALEQDGKALTFTVMAQADAARGGRSAAAAQFQVSLAGEEAQPLTLRLNENGHFYYQLNGLQASGRYAVNGAELWLCAAGVHADFVIPAWAAGDSAEDSDDGTIRAPMDGKLLEVAVAVGDKVQKGQLVAVLEAMKMEHQLLAGRDGVVAEVNAVSAQQVASGARLVEIAE